MSASPVVIVIVIIYLLAMILIGLLSSRKIKDKEDFLLAGRRLGPIMMAGTLAATELGGGSSLGVVEKAYGDWGLSAIWYVIAMGVVFVIMAFLAPYFRNSLVKTVPEYFFRRYGKPSGIVTSIIMILPLIGLTAIQFIASATVLSVMANWGYNMSVIVVSMVVVAYSIMGGLWSVTLTDVVQMVLIVIGMAAGAIFALHAVGGWSEIVANTSSEKISIISGMGVPTIIALTVMYLASFSVGQEAVQRYYAARNAKTAMQGSLIAAGIYLVFAIIPVVIGLSAHVMVDKGIIDGTLIVENGMRYVLPTLAVQLMPPILVGILFASLISVTMSSASSDLLAAGSIFANDIYKRYFKKDSSSDNILKITRYSMIIVGIFSLLIALTNTSSIISVLMFSFTLRAGGACLPYILGHFWKKSSPSGAIASLVFGSMAIVLVEQHVIPFDFPSIYLGLIVSIVCFYFGSLFWPPLQKGTDLKPEE